MSTSSSTVQSILFNVLNQRNRTLQLSQPPIRYNPVSPYPEYSQFQLNMRRKVEILKYNDNSTQTNTILTKAQTWAQLVNGKITRNTSTIVSHIPVTNYLGNIIGNTSVSQIYNVHNCPIDAYLSTPSTASNIPGPLFYLKNDPAVPLYNYTVNTQVLSIINDGVLPDINVYSFNVLLTSPPYSSNIVNTNTNMGTVASISINSLPQSKCASTYTISVPIQMYVSGTLNTDTSGNSGNIFIDKYTCSIYYSDSEVYTVSKDISGTNISFRTNSTNSIKTFSGYIYIGNIDISNIPLVVDVGFLYDIKLQFRLSVPAPTFSYSNYVVGVNSNITNPTRIQTNCEFYNPPTTPTFHPFSFT